jgi:hypothetical protein
MHGAGILWANGTACEVGLRSSRQGDGNAPTPYGNTGCGSSAAIAIAVRLTAAPFEVSGVHSTADSDAKKESSPMAADNLEQRGRELRASCEDAFRRIRASGQTSFADAGAGLRGAVRDSLYFLIRT